MNAMKNEKSVELKLRKLLDDVVLEPEQRKLAMRALRQLLQANRVSDLKSLRKAIDRFLGLILVNTAGVERSDD